MSLRGYRLELVPMPLLQYRQSGGSHLLTATDTFRNKLRALRPYARHLQPGLRLALELGYSAARAKAHLRDP
jgi:hypothetical protein